MTSDVFEICSWDCWCLLLLSGCVCITFEVFDYLRDMFTRLSGNIRVTLDVPYYIRDMFSWLRMLPNIVRLPSQYVRVTSDPFCYLRHMFVWLRIHSVILKIRSCDCWCFLLLFRLYLGGFKWLRDRFMWLLTSSIAFLDPLIWGFKFLCSCLSLSGMIFDWKSVENIEWD